MDQTLRDCCAIAVMAKASVPGRTKTRLCPPLSWEAAAQFNTAFLRDIAGNIDQAGRSVFLHSFMAYSPAGSGPFFRSILPGHVGLIEAVAPDFGSCLFTAIDQLLRLGYGSAVVLNSDSPTLPSAYLTAAAVTLAASGDRAVIGPSTDGGYYLLGLKRAHRRLFEDVDWSTDRVSRQTLERCAEIELPVTVLPEWYDVDDSGSLAMLAGELRDDRPFRRVGPEPAKAANSRRVLDAVWPGRADGDGTPSSESTAA